MSSYYVLLRVGCSECGVPSDVLGVWTERAPADKAFEAAAPREGGEVDREPREYEETYGSTLLRGTRMGSQAIIELHRYDA